MIPELVTDESKRAPCSNGTKLSLSERTLLSFHEAYRYTCNTLSTALGISRISKVTISSSEPVCLLAKMYPDATSDSVDSNDEQESMTAALSQFEEDLSQRLWFSYRTGFSPLGEDQLTGDAGWGCTLRSCQMLLAQALLMHLCGRSTHTAQAEQTATRQHVVSWFHDSPEPCFSIHSICAAGAKYGLVPGRWMGPYALCRTVADIAAARCPDSLHVTVIESGGGAPCIDPDRLKRSFEAPACDAAPHGSSNSSGGVPPQGLLALVPVVLGVERLNSVYAQQLKAILRWPHSVGIVGGRPGHSYYFMGFQGDRLICMDPHVMQATDGEPGALDTHGPLGVQSVPIAAIDSTMALGFYCRSAADVDRLAEAVQELADACSRSPLLSLGSLPDVQAHDCDCAWDSEEDQADAEGGVLVGSTQQGGDSGDVGNHGMDESSHPAQAAPERAPATGDTPSSPVLVSGSLSSMEVASTGVSGWEIVDSCG